MSAPTSAERSGYAESAARVTEALFDMTKVIMADREAAAAGEPAVSAADR